jgi:hypothetical protein
MSLNPETSDFKPDRIMQERAASATGGAAIGLVVELCGGIEVMAQDTAIGQAVNQNLVAFSTELGRPINEITAPGYTPQIPVFCGIDSNDSVGIIPKLATAFELYTKAVRNGWEPWKLQAYIGERYAHTSPDEIQRLGVDSALIQYEKQWSNEAPAFDTGA